MILKDSVYSVYSASFRIQSKCGKIRTGITPNKYTFYAVTVNQNLRVVNQLTLLLLLLLIEFENFKEGTVSHSILK